MAHLRPVPQADPVSTASFGINVLSYKKVPFLIYKQQSLVENTVSHTNTQTHSIMYKMITVLVVYHAFISQNFDANSFDRITIPLGGHEILGWLHTYVATYIKICLYILHKNII